MAVLEWDRVGSRDFETGLDRGVLYLSSGRGVAWNGLTSVVEGKTGGEHQSYYLDGVKYMESRSREDLSGQITAFTYPDEFLEYNGVFDVNGLGIHNQPHSTFNFSYRTLLGDDVKGVKKGYRIHVVYNVLAMMTDNTYSSLSDTIDPTVFTWDFTTIPIYYETRGRFVYTSHITIDTTKVSSWKVDFLETQLYGSETTTAKLPDMGILIDMFEVTKSAYLTVRKSSSGVNPVVMDYKASSNLSGNGAEGLYTPTPSSSIVTSTTGLFTLES